MEQGSTARDNRGSRDRDGKKENKIREDKTG